MGVILNWSSNYPATVDDTVTNFPTVSDGTHDVLASHLNELAGAVIQLETIQDGLATAPPAHQHLEADVTDLTHTAAGGSGTDTTAIHDDTAGEITAITPKAFAVANDVFLMEDTDSGGVKKSIVIGDFPFATNLQEAYEGGADIDIGETGPVTINAVTDAEDALILSSDTSNDALSVTAGRVTIAGGVLTRLQGDTVVGGTAMQGSEVFRVQGTALFSPTIRFESSGGLIDLTSVFVSGASGGAFSISGSRAGQGTAQPGPINGGIGGIVNVTAGQGGPGVSSDNPGEEAHGGVGGILTVAGGIGGNGNDTFAFNSIPGKGGGLTLRGGNASSINNGSDAADGGVVLIHGGAPVNGGVVGNVFLGTNSTPEVIFDSLKVKFNATVAADALGDVGMDTATGRIKMFVGGFERDVAYVGEAGGLPAVDTTAIVKGSADATKLVRFEVDGLTTATTRVITVPDQDLTLIDTADSRLSDARTPTTHASSHQNAGGDEISVVGLSGLLADPQTAGGLKSATGIVSVSAATAPTAGQVLKATSPTAATWQADSGGGGSSWTITAVRTATDTAAVDERVLYDASGGTFTITAPPSPTTGDRFAVKNVDKTFAAIGVTIDSGTAAGIQEVLTSAISTDFLWSGTPAELASLVWFYDGTDWLLE